MLALLVATLFHPLTVKAQGIEYISDRQLRMIVESDQIPLHREVNIDGTPFLVDDFLPGTIILPNGRTTETMQLRYNTYNQSVDFMSNGEAHRIDGQLIREFTLQINGVAHTFKKGFDASRLDESDFVQILEDGALTFFVKHTTNLIEDTASYGVATRNDVYRPNENYYVREKSGNIDRLRRLDERRLRGYFKDYEDEIASFVSANNIDYTNPSDVASLFRHYNSLVQNTQN